MGVFTFSSLASHQPVSPRLIRLRAGQDEVTDLFSQLECLCTLVLRACYAL
jgi:hypothetical protein